MNTLLCKLGSEAAPEIAGQCGPLGRECVRRPCVGGCWWRVVLGQLQTGPATGSSTPTSPRPCRSLYVQHTWLSDSTGQVSGRAATSCLRTRTPDSCWSDSETAPGRPRAPPTSHSCCRLSSGPHPLRPWLHSPAVLTGAVAPPDMTAHLAFSWSPPDPPHLNVKVWET